MSTFRNPVGPQAPQVYWRRRLMVGLGLLAVVVVVLLIVFRPAGAATDDETPTDGTPASAEPTEPAQEEGAACNPENIELKAVTDKSQYASGQQPMISMSIVNNGSVACVLNVGTTQQVFTITSGSETYWTSTDCQSEPIDLDQVMEPGVAQSTTPIPWDRTRSSKATCTSERSPVTAGGASYHLNVSLGDIEAESTAQFLLH